MTSDTQKPLASQALIDYLDRCYPDRTPDIGRHAAMSDREVWIAAGQVSVVRKLKADLKTITQPDEE